MSRRQPPALAFVTLGCPKNTVDSESMLGLLVRDGFRTVGDARDADVAVVNTCAFLQSAVRESKDAISQLAALKRGGRLRGLIVTGCLAQRAGGSLLDEFPEVDAVLGTGQWKEVVHAAHHVLGRSREKLVNTDYPGGALDVLVPRALSTPRHLAYLKISEGCDHRCTFCIIPRLRGDQQSRPIADLVAEARRLVAVGVRELNLIGQDTTGYGTDLPDQPTLADLLEALDRIEGLDWIRVQYTYPRLWDDRLISTWANAKRVVPYVDMPLQHIAQDMLRTMARGMTEPDTRELVRRIKRGIPNVAFRTNFIVGFPGETEQHFETLCRFVEEEPFDHVVVFPYEREPETPSDRMTPRVPVAERRRRRAHLLGVQQRVSRERLAKRIGERVTVMVDGPADSPRGEAPGRRWAARTTGQAFEVDGGVALEGEGVLPGQLVPARVTGTGAYDLFAKVERPNPAALPLLGEDRMTRVTAVLAIVLGAWLARDAHAKTFRYSSGPQAPTDTVLSVAQPELEPIVRARGPRVPMTNLQLVTLVSKVGFDRALASAPLDSGGHVVLAPAENHPLNYVVEHSVLRHLARRGVSATVRRSVVPDDSLSMMARDADDPLLEYQLASARITYLRLRGWLPGRVKIERQALVEGALTLRDPRTGNVLWAGDVSHNLLDAIPRSQLGFVEDARYAELKSEVPTRSVDKALEPVVVVAIVGGLIALFFQNRP